MNRNHAVRIARGELIREILVLDCPICRKDLHLEFGINMDNWEEVIEHLMSHTENERKDAGIKFKGRPNTNEMWDGMNY